MRNENRFLSAQVANAEPVLVSALVHSGASAEDTGANIAAIRTLLEPSTAIDFAHPRRQKPRFNLSQLNDAIAVLHRVPGDTLRGVNKRGVLADLSEQRERLVRRRRRLKIVAGVLGGVSTVPITFGAIHMAHSNQQRHHQEAARLEAEKEIAHNKSLEENRVLGTEPTNASLNNWRVSYAPTNTYQEIPGVPNQFTYVEDGDIVSFVGTAQEKINDKKNLFPTKGSTDIRLSKFVRSDGSETIKITSYNIIRKKMNGYSEMAQHNHPSFYLRVKQEIKYMSKLKNLQQIMMLSFLNS